MDGEESLSEVLSINTNCWGDIWKKYASMESVGDCSLMPT
jgi:hypothetical protein